MAQPDFYNFYLMPDATTWAYIDDSGGLVLTNDEAEGVAHPLRSSPDNWEDIEQSWERSKSLHGISTKITGNYIFSGDGSIILKRFITVGGFTTRCRLRVDKLNLDSTAWTYDIYQEGDISFEQPKLDLTSVEISLFEQGIGQDLKQNLSTKYEIPIDITAEAIQVYFSGTRVNAIYNYRFSGSTINVPLVPGLGSEIYFTLLLSNTNNEGFKPVAIPQTVEPMVMGDSTSIYFYGSEEYSKFALSNADTQGFATTLIVSDITVGCQFNPTFGGTRTGFFTLYAITTPFGGDLFTERIQLFLGTSHAYTSSTEFTETFAGFILVLSDIPASQNLYIVASFTTTSTTGDPTGLMAPLS